MTIIDITGLEFTCGWNIPVRARLLSNTLNDGWRLYDDNNGDDPYVAAAQLINRSVGIKEVEMLACNFSVSHERNGRKAINEVWTAVIIRLRHDGFISEKRRSKNRDPMKAFTSAYVQALMDICQARYPDKMVLLASDQCSVTVARKYLHEVGLLATREPEELEEYDPPEDESLVSDEPSGPGPTAALSIEQQGWDEWEAQICFSEWHPRG